MGKNDAPGVAVVTRGNGTVATPLYAALLHAQGGRWFEHGQPTVAGRQSVEALQVIGRLLGGYAPPKIGQFGWQEASALFMAGGAAMYLEDSSIYLLMEDPSESTVAGKVAYALFPSGPGGPGTTLSVRGLAVAKQSANPTGAWLFCQWAASPEMVKRAFQRRILVARESVWRTTTPEKPLPEGLAQAFQEAGRIGVTDYAPPMVAVTAGREAVGKALEAAIRGEDIRGAAEAANRRMQEILRVTEPARRAARTP
jgi:multiple sugar transport system substrate-binding protein